MFTEKLLKEDNRQKISVFLDESTGRKYIERRIFDDKRDVYKIIKNLQHPNLAKILGVNFDTDTVIYEEYIDAVPLTELMDNNMPLGKSEVKKIALGVISAMEALHGAGIIHRDIKPDNIMVDSDFNVWLIDFDIARIYRPQMRRDTEQMGTFGYAPIEQYGMMPTDFKTDIYSFGVTLCNILEYAGIGGKMLKIAKKCKMLDPALRYESASKVRKALTAGIALWICPAAALVFVTIVLCILFMQGRNYDLPVKSDAGKKRDTPKNLTISGLGGVGESVSVREEKAVSEKQSEDAVPEKTVKEDTVTTKEAIADDEYFVGYSPDSAYLKYKDYFNFSSVCIFSTPWNCDHLVMLEDGTQKGKIKLGKNTLADGEFTLKNGVLAVSLADDKGHKFSHSFYFDNQYEFDKYYNENLRRNADMICKDLDYDGSYELLVGLGEGVTGVDGGDFYNYFNYCIGWCICYDEAVGFTLCKGDMFSRGKPFVMSEHTGNILPAYTGEYDNPFMIYLDDKRIVSAYY